jgi:hypothetical protein
VPDPDLDELWQRIMAAWDDDDAHAAFLERCRAMGQLGQAAARYREELRGGAAYREDATRAESAQKRLHAVTALALMELEATRTDGVPAHVLEARTVITWLAAAILAAALGFAAWKLFSG